MCRMQCGWNGRGRVRRLRPPEPETTGSSARCGRRQRTPKRRLTGVTGFHSVHEMGRAPQPIAEFKSSVCGQLGRLQNSRDMEPVRGHVAPDFVRGYSQDYSQDRPGLVFGAQGNGGWGKPGEAVGPEYPLAFSGRQVQQARQRLEIRFQGRGTGWRRRLQRSQARRQLCR